MAKILLVSDTKNFITASIVKQLEEQEHKVMQVGYDLYELDNITEVYDFVLIYAEENADTLKLMPVKRIVIADYLPVFVAGDDNQIKEIKDIIPEQFVKNSFVRPVNPKDIVEEIIKYLNNDESYSKKKILVVDDSGAVLRNVKAWLENKYQIILANSGTMAIKYLTMNRPDLILLDYEMPICDGRQVLEMIRSDKDFADVPVIFLTSKNDKESVMKVTELKPDGYLLKTMSPKDIVKAVDDFFARKEQ